MDAELHAFEHKVEQKFVVVFERKLSAVVASLLQGILDEMHGGARWQVGGQRNR